MPVQVEALDSDGQVTSVSRYADGQLLDTVAQAPYIFQWLNAPLGTHLLRAVATDDAQQQATLDLTVTVLANVPPNVTLTTPREGAVFTVGEPIELAAEAFDLEGSVQ